MVEQAISIHNLNALVVNNRFVNVSNSKFFTYGGCVYVSGSAFSDLRIESNHFQECRAMRGGAIAFDDQIPLIGSKNTYQDNSALISGNTIVFYP